MKMLINFLLIALCLLTQGVYGQESKPLHVYAPSGLNLRESSDANSAKIMTVPMGESITLLAPSASNSMTVDGLSGGMAKVEYQGKVGYMFSGYLVPISISNQDEDLEQYLARLRGEGQEVYYEEIKRDYDGYYQSEYNYIFPFLSWQEAFLLAKYRFNMPQKLNFPPMKGKGTVTTVNPDKTSEAWTDEMQVTYNAKGELSKVLYVRRGEGGGMQVRVEFKEDDPRGLLMGALYIAD